MKYLVPVFLLGAAGAFAPQPSPDASRRSADLSRRSAESAEAEDAKGDRIVAERVLRLGGAVILAGQRAPIRDIDDLPDGD